MKRLVYSPSINVYIKTDHGVIDLSDYVTDCSVNRVVNQVSTATVTFRNPKVITTSGKNRFMFTEHESSDGRVGPVFHPMDPIIITMTRLRGKPIQVFTGYCDTSAYVQLYPGVAELQASCTLKRLLHTYWDPGLAFVNEFMRVHGWYYNQDTGVSYQQNPKNAKTAQLNDTGIGNLLIALLNEVGGWEKEDLILQPLPSKSIQESVAKIFSDLVDSGKANSKQYVDYVSEFVTAAGTVNGSPSGTGATTTNSSSSSSTVIPPYNGKQGELTPLEAKSAAKSMLSSFGWGEDQWPDLETLWDHESSWKMHNPNPHSEADGIPQALPASKMASTADGGGPDYATNAITQIRWGLNYIKNRYGSPSAAWTFWQNPTNSPPGASTNWY